MDIYNMNRNEEMITIQTVNIQGMNEMKKYEIEKLTERNNVITGVIETHLKEDRFNWNQEYEIYEQRREKGDKKGGGLLILHRKQDDIDMEKIETGHQDVLAIKGKLKGKIVTIILVYMATGSTQESRQRNTKIHDKINKIIDENQERSGIVLMGDFNGHLGLLGSQQEDENGRRVKQIVTEHNLSIMNLDDRCKGEHTWHRGEQKSVIDFIIINKEMMEFYQEMTVDEEQHKWDISDHNLLEIIFKWNTNIIRNKENKNEVTWYWKFEEETLEEYIREIETRLDQKRVDNIEELNGMIREVADAKMRRQYIRKKNKKGSTEPPWITKEIKEGIKERRKINRERRNETDPVKKEELWVKYLEKKMEVKEEIRNKIREYERSVSEEIKQNKNKMWENIRKLKGETKKRDTEMYSDTGEKLNEEEQRAEIKQYWTEIYCKHDNHIENSWNDNQKELYRETREKMEVIGHTRQLVNNFPEETRDHLDMSMTIEKPISAMERIEINESKVKEVIRRIKKKKAAGPDGLKGELYSEMAKSEKCLSALTRCMNNELNKKSKPQSWKKSRTVLLEKKRKPTARDFRPVALTDISYKIYMSLIRNEIEQHLENIDETLEEQAGFTKGCRIEDNLAILKYLVDNSRKGKRELIITAIDFAKAFDSVKRDTIIDTLKWYKVDERVIETVAEIYTNDMVHLVLGDNIEENIVAKSGIRQGCTLSATLFKLITYRIIKEINRKMKGYQTDKITIRALFFADDGLLMSDDVQQTATDIITIQEIAEKYGLGINKGKSNILIFNRKGTQTMIEGIEIQNEIKYLGITIEDYRDIFRKHKQKKLQLAEKLANNTYSVINRCSNKMIIGKTYWKSIAIPAIIYGSGVIEWNQQEQQKLQVIENRVCRKILHAPRWAANSALRGETGISKVETRLMHNRLGYINNRLDEGNTLIKIVVEELVTKGKWKKTIEKYCNDLDSERESLLKLKKTELKRKTRDWDTENWKQEMELKKTLYIYKENKQEIKEEEYDNDPISEIWFRGKTNCMNLGDRIREGSKECKLCGAEREDQCHFIIHCDQLSDIRKEEITLQRPTIQNENQIISNFFFGKENKKPKMRTLYRMWSKRNSLLRERIPN